jgi:uncharacterized damage-inducible protein DinB
VAGRQELLRQFALLESDRQQLLARLDPLDPLLLGARPSPMAWSVAQVITHLAMAEEGVLAYLRKKIQYGGHGPVGRSAPFRLAFLNLALDLPIKYKAPRAVAHVPVTDHATARARWDAVRTALRSTLVDLEEEVLDHGLVKHPSAGKFTPVQGLRFMRKHVRHHRGQIVRTLRQVAP